MKTLLEVRQEIQDLIYEGNLLVERPAEKARLARIKNRIKWLRLAEGYLSCESDTEYITKSLPLTRIKLQNLLRSCPHDRADQNPEIKKAVKDWDKKEGVTKLRDQIKFMAYLNY